MTPRCRSITINCHHKQGGKMRKLLLALIITSSLWANNVVTKTAFVNASDTKGKSLVQVREMLLIRAKRAAASEIFGDYINSSTVVNSGRLVSDEINSIVNGVIHIKGDPIYSNGKNFGDMQVRATMYATDQEMKEAKQRLKKVMQEVKHTQKRQAKVKKAPVQQKKVFNCSDNLPSDPVKRSQAMAECEQNKFDSEFD